jgi:thiamine-phosphate pyrophosphorylase
MPAGSAFIFRHFGKAPIINMAKCLRSEAKKGSVLFIVGQDHNLALTIGADGLHVPNWDRKLLSSKIKFPAHFLITASAHNQEELQSITGLHQTPVHIFVSPVFQTTSPSGIKRSIWELNELMSLIKSNPMIINALGGINRTNIHSLKAMGFGGIGLGSLKDLSGQDINL